MNEFLQLIKRQAGGQVLPSVNNNFARVAPARANFNVNTASIAPILQAQQIALSGQRLEEDIFRDRRDVVLDQIKTFKADFDSRITPEYLDTSNAQELALFTEQQALLGQVQDLGIQTMLRPGTAQQKLQALGTLQGEITKFYSRPEVIQSIQANADTQDVTDFLLSANKGDIRDDKVINDYYEALQNFKQGDHADVGNRRKLIQAHLAVRTRGIIDKTTADAAKTQVTNFVQDAAFADEWMIKNGTGSEDDKFLTLSEDPTTKELETRKAGLMEFIKNDSTNRAIAQSEYDQYVAKQTADGKEIVNFDEWLKKDVDRKFSIAFKSDATRRDQVGLIGRDVANSLANSRARETDTQANNNKIQLSQEQSDDRIREIEAQDVANTNPNSAAGINARANATRAAAELAEAQNNGSSSGLNLTDLNDEERRFANVFLDNQYQPTRAELEDIASSTNKLTSGDLGRIISLAEQVDPNRNLSIDEFTKAMKGDSGFDELFGDDDRITRTLFDIYSRGKTQTESSSSETSTSSGFTPPPGSIYETLLAQTQGTQASTTETPQEGNTTGIQTSTTEARPVRIEDDSTTSQRTTTQPQRTAVEAPGVSTTPGNTANVPEQTPRPEVNNPVRVPSGPTSIQTTGSGIQTPTPNIIRTPVVTPQPLGGQIQSINVGSTSRPIPINLDVSNISQPVREILSSPDLIPSEQIRQVITPATTLPEAGALVLKARAAVDELPNIQGIQAKSLPINTLVDTPPRELLGSKLVTITNENGANTIVLPEEVSINKHIGDLEDSNTIKETIISNNGVENLPKEARHLVQPDVKISDSTPPKTRSKVTPKDVMVEPNLEVKPPNRSSTNFSEEVQAKQIAYKKIGFINTVDGVEGPNTRRADSIFSNIAGKGGQNLEVVSADGKLGSCDIYHCAAYNSELGAVIFGMNKEDYQTKFESVGDAWDRFFYMERAGGFRKDINNWGSFKIGDVVQLEREKFSGKDKSHEAAKDTSNRKSGGNQHIGTVVGMNTRGVPLVAHNFHGEVYVEPINSIDKAFRYEATSILQPNDNAIRGGVNLIRNVLF